MHLSSCFTPHNIGGATGVAATVITKYLSLPLAAMLTLHHSRSALPTNGIGVSFFYPNHGAVTL